MYSIFVHLYSIKLKTLWKFSRPHTIIGSFLSISVLFILSQNTSYLTYGLVLISALLCNLFITGINQIYDVDIDKINKPELPIASGKWSIQKGKKIVFTSLILMSVFSSALIVLWGKAGIFYFLLLVVIALLGAAYSAPPIRFKRFHIWAATAIALVRGPLVNLGIGWFFIETSDQVLFHSEFYDWLLPLTVFISLFSVGIAWFKDLPDTAGDLEHGIQTLAVKKSKSTAFRLGFLLVFGGFLFVLIYMGYITKWSGESNNYEKENNSFYFMISQLLGLISFSLASFQVKIHSNNSLKIFYKIYWVLFFLMYLSYLFLL